MPKSNHLPCGRRATPWRGFTLIELMVVVTIIGVLASIAAPAYFNYVRESNRSDAMVSLTKMLAQQELYFGNNGQYAAEVDDLGYKKLDTNTDTTLSPDGLYQVKMTNCANPGVAITATDLCIRLTATPAAYSSQAKDTSCNQFIIDSTGKRTSKNKSNAPSTSTCWK